MPMRPADLGKLIAVGLCLICTGCSDSITTNYATRSSAEGALLFERGWLPRIIPESSTHIRVRSRLDTNQAEGEFYFDPPEFESFTANLAVYRSGEKDLDVESLRGKLGSGYVAYRYVHDDSRWIFLIDKNRGHAVFRME